MTTVPISVTVNGEERAEEVEPRLLLVHFIRETLGLTGTHIGCDTTHCGACTVSLDGRPVKSCTIFAVQANGREVNTVESLEQGGETSSHPAGLYRRTRSAVRLLYPRDDDDRRDVSARQSRPIRR